MTTKLNLAGKPFSNKALPWVLTTLIVFVSLVAFVLIIRSASQANAQSRSVQADIRRLDQEAKEFQERTEQVKQFLSGEQQQTLAAAHQLVDRKEFSWSRLLADLEAALPGNVRVTRISVREVVTRGGQTVAGLDLAVMSVSASTITEMIADMDRAGIFQADLRNQNLQKGRGASGTEYELYVLYRPRAGTAVSEAARDNIASAGGADRAENESPR